MMGLEKLQRLSMIFLHAMFPNLFSSFQEGCPCEHEIPVYQCKHVGKRPTFTHISGWFIFLRGEHTSYTSHVPHVYQLWNLILITTHSAPGNVRRRGAC